MRLSRRTITRLEALRELDDMTLQEHIRRGLEYYLDHIEVSIALSASEALRNAAQTTKQYFEERGVPRTEIVPSLLANHAPRPVRPPAPRISPK